MFHGDRGGICIQHLPPKWRWQLPGRRSSPQISMLLYHLFIYDFLGFPMCFLCVSLFLYVFFPWFSFFSCCFFQVYSQVFPHVFPAPPRPSGRNIPRSQRTPPREVESCSQVRGDTKKWDMYGDFMFFMGYQWTSMEFESGFRDVIGIWMGISWGFDGVLIIENCEIHGIFNISTLWRTMNLGGSIPKNGILMGCSGDLNWKKIWKHRR